METSWYYCLHWSGRYLPYLDPPYINPPFDLCVWGLGGNGGGFLDSEVELAILISHDREVHSIQEVQLLTEDEMENQTALH